MVLLAGFALLGLRGVVRLAFVARDLRQAENLVDEASTALVEGRLRDATRALDRAEGLVLGANEALRDAPELDLVGWVPGFHQNLVALEESVELAATVIHGGVRILAESDPLQSAEGTLEVSLSDGTVPLEAVAAAQQRISELSTHLLPAIRKDAPPLLLPPVRELRDAVHDEAVSRSQQLEVLGRGLGLLRHLAGGEGPRRYLLAVSNTAEMRGTGGMILNYGVLEGADGTIDLTDFGRIDELGPVGPVPPELLPTDYLARWAGFDARTRFRQANLAGDFTLVAPTLEAMYTSATDRPVDGVIQVDPEGLAAILEAVGPVTVPEVGQVTSETVVALTLNEAYFRFPNVEERSDVLGDVAEAAFRRLVDGDFPSLRPLAESIVEAVDGRHFVMHSATAAVEAAITAFGADGAYPPIDEVDTVALTAQNLAGNKLDYYLDTDLQLTGERPQDQLGTMTARITLTNTAPAGVTEPRYIFGPGVSPTSVPAGVLRSVVTLYLPFGSSLEGAAGDATVEPASSGTEGGRPYASFIVDVPASEVRTVELTLQLAPRTARGYELRLVPAPRVRPTTVTLDIATEAGALAGRVELNREWVVVPGRAPVASRPPAYR